MCFKFPAFFGIEIQEIERTPYGRQVVKTKTYGYTGPKEHHHEKRRRSRRDSYHSHHTSSSSNYTAVPATMPPPPTRLPPPRYEYDLARPDYADNVDIVDAIPPQQQQYALLAAPSPPFRQQTVSHRPQSGRYEQPMEYGGRTHRVGLPAGVTVERRNTVAASAVRTRRPDSGVRYVNARDSRSSSSSDTDSSLSSSDASSSSELGAGRRRR